MAGTKLGAQRAADTNRERHGLGFYPRIGRLGGIGSRPEKRFYYMNREAARAAGKKGGLKSRRIGVKNAKDSAKDQEAAKEA